MLLIRQRPFRIMGEPKGKNRRREANTVRDLGNWQTSFVWVLTTTYQSWIEEMHWQDTLSSGELREEMEPLVVRVLVPGGWRLMETVQGLHERVRQERQTVSDSQGMRRRTALEEDGNHSEIRSVKWRNDHFGDMQDRKTPLVWVGVCALINRYIWWGQRSK